MRSDANAIALRAVRSILDAAESFALSVAGQHVVCTASRGDRADWPQHDLADLDPVRDGPWPTPVDVRCRWDGGSVALQTRANFAVGGTYRHEISVFVGLRDRGRLLLWSNVARAVGDAPDGDKVSVEGAVSLTKRNQDRAESQRRNRALQDLVGGTSLPLLSRARVQLCELEVPTGFVLPTPETAFRRLIELVLLKLEFLDRGPRAADRGRALVDLSVLGLEAAAEAAGNEPADEDDDDEPEVTLEAAHGYWAGGVMPGQDERLAEFTGGNYWEHGYSRDDPTRSGQRTWELFAQIKPGDSFAIKGHGENLGLRVHYVGEVTDVDVDRGRVTLRELDQPLYVGKAPRGAGGGHWSDTLVPVTRPEVIAAIFGTRSSILPPPRDLPVNLILYGPPGTGKTYALQTEYAPQFIRHTSTASASEEVERATEVLGDLPWWQVVALALHDLGGSVRVEDLLGHRWLEAKYAAQGIPTKLGPLVWGALQQHTIEASATVRYSRRSGVLLFDKRPDGTWYFAQPIPEELVELAKQLRSRGSAIERRDYEVVTFHQSYSYEDFIEGIRPRLSAAQDEGDEGLRYALEDGVFLRAVRAAIRLTGFRGTLDEFCRLDQSERGELLEKAPHYAIFIDEINRGNVARIFGELITVLEEDKRLGAQSELIVTLPYSRTLFGVPSNLHVIGTMNTADRSVEALDTALRRRFSFEELAPKPELLDFTVEGQIHVGAMLQKINLRLERLHDRDHCIGHAYFVTLREEPTLERLKLVFRRAVLPLLQEYFFGDWGKIGLVLGKDFVKRRDHGLAGLAEFAHEDREIFNERATYELVSMDHLTNQSFRRIYENVPDDA